MKLINQKFDLSCGVACLAMWLDKTHEEIRLKHFPDRDFTKEGISAYKLVEVLESEGVVSIDYPGWLTRVPGILSVPSLNIENSMHFIFWGGPGKLYDPQEGIPSKKYYKCSEIRNHQVSSHIVSGEYEGVRRTLASKIQHYKTFLDKFNG